MTYFPFVCLGIGTMIGIQTLSDRTLKQVDWAINATLVVLMLTIGMKIGVNHEMMQRLHLISFNCFVLAASAILFSVLFTRILEIKWLPLEQMRVEESDNALQSEADQCDGEQTSPLIWIMPLSILMGIVVGYFLLGTQAVSLLGHVLMVSLVILYIGVGISLGNNRGVFKDIRKVGFRITWLSVAIFLGSLVGGFVAGLVLKLPYEVSLLSTCGMSYYSLTGAFMTNAYGIETGTYGFVVNVMREFLTVLCLPFLIKISKGSPIAGGAAGNMDTMLVPITKFVGPELGLVTLITGTILTFSVPVILPLLAQLIR